MTRNTLFKPHAQALVAIVAATLMLAACRQHDTSVVAPPVIAPTSAALTVKPPPPPATMAISTVELGNAVDAAHHIVKPMTAFAPTDSIHASIASDGIGGHLMVQWRKLDQIVASQDKAVAGGPQVTDFSASQPGGWATGRYTLRVSMDGHPVQSRTFDVK